MEGVGLAYDAAKISPVTWVDVENVPLESSASEKPVMKVAAAGLSPMFPVIADVGTLVTPVSARIVKLAAERKLTAGGPAA